MKIDELIEKNYVERITIKTPAGGDYAEAHYFDENNNYTTKENSDLMIIKEYKNDGTLLNETFRVRTTPVEQEQNNKIK